MKACVYFLQVLHLANELNRTLVLPKPIGSSSRYIWGYRLGIRLLCQRTDLNDGCRSDPYSPLANSYLSLRARGSSGFSTGNLIVRVENCRLAEDPKIASCLLSLGFSLSCLSEVGVAKVYWYYDFSELFLATTFRKQQSY
jgi:hypothetical protein